MVRRKIPRRVEDIWNIPNTLTFLRVVITLATMYCIFAGFNIVLVVVLFSVGMFTDFLDGQIARRFNLVTEFGAKFDMIADRFLLIGVVGALVIDSFSGGLIGRTQILQIFLVMSRELISMPFALVAFVANKPIPPARFVGKLTTCLQAFALPCILLSASYTAFSFAPYLATLTSIVGLFSAVTYINDLSKEGVR